MTVQKLLEDNEEVKSKLVYDIKKIKKENLQDYHIQDYETWNDKSLVNFMKMKESDFEKIYEGNMIENPNWISNDTFIPKVSEYLKKKLNNNFYYTINSQILEAFTFKQIEDLRISTGSILQKNQSFVQTWFMKKFWKFFDA